MMKFKIYRAISILFFLLTLLVSFSPVRASEQWNEVRTVATMSILILFFVCYSFLISIFNYFKEPGWKNVAVIIFLSGNSFFYFLSISHSMPNIFFNFFILIFYVPFILAFASVNEKEIKPLMQSFAYLMLIICVLHIVLPFVRDKINLSVYIYAFNGIFLLPSVMMVLIFHKMAAISAKRRDEELMPDEEEDHLL
jgi:hypothetical protein